MDDVNPQSDPPPPREDPPAPETEAGPASDKPIGPTDVSPLDTPRPAVPVPKQCRLCGKTLPAHWTFCPDCKRPVYPAATAEPMMPRPASPPASPYAYWPPGYGRYVPPPIPPEVRRRRHIGLFSALGLFVALLATSLVMLALAWVQDLSDVTLDLAIISIDAVLVLSWMGATFWWFRKPLRTFGAWWWYPLAPAAAACTFAITTLYHYPIVELLDVEYITYSEMFLSEGFGWWLVILSVCLQPAVIEEIAFRGVIYSGLRELVSEPLTIFISAVMFMAIHLTPFSFPPLLLIGLALGYIRSRTGSLYPCMLMHFTHNFLVIGSEYYAETLRSWGLGIFG